MNIGGGLRWKKGFSRLWVLAAVLWALAVLGLGEPWEEIRFYADSSEQLSRISIANDKLDAAQITGEIDGKSVDSDQIERLRATVEVHRNDTERRVEDFPSNALGFVALLIGPPLLILIFGLAISWVLAGFKSNAIAKKSE